MLLAFALATMSFADWVPMRWISAEPKSLELIKGSSVNCLLLEEAQWSEPFVRSAREANFATLAVVQAGSADPGKVAERALALKVSGVVLQGDFPETQRTRIRELATRAGQAFVQLPSRAHMKLDSNVTGTYQGVWPGIDVDEQASSAAPSGTPWIHTNAGFLRYVRAATNAPIWIGYGPPKAPAITRDRYLQAISDAGMAGAHWIVELQPEFSKRLLAREEKALAEWKAIGNVLAFYVQHRGISRLPPLSTFALLQNREDGALYSGGILDMIATHHVPVRPLGSNKLSEEAFAGLKTAVVVNPAALDATSRSALDGFKQKGGKVFQGAEDWSFPPVTPERITLDEKAIEKLDGIWKEVTTLTQRNNLGARLFNVSSMLSNLLATGNGTGAVLHLVNYSGFGVENVTVHLLNKYRKAEMLAPGEPPRNLEVYDNGEGSGVDIDRMGVTAILRLER